MPLSSPVEPVYARYWCYLPNFGQTELDFIQYTQSLHHASPKARTVFFLNLDIACSNPYNSTDIHIPVPFFAYHALQAAIMSPALLLQWNRKSKCSVGTTQGRRMHAGIQPIAERGPTSARFAGLENAVLSASSVHGFLCKDQGPGASSVARDSARRLQFLLVTVQQDALSVTECYGRLIW